MANDIKITSSSHCYGCLAKNDGKNLGIYHIQGVSLQKMLQTKQLMLCYICNKLARNTERFIYNVVTAQNMFKVITNIRNDNIRSAMKPLDLKVFLLDQDAIIQVEGHDEDDEKIKIEYDNDFLGKELDKEYIKHEQSEGFIEDDNVENFINSLGNKYNVKDDTCLLELSTLKRKRIKNEKTSKKKIRTQKIKKESELAEEIDAQIETLYLTDEQCLEERDQRRIDSVYLSCEFKCFHCLKGFSYRPSFEKHMEKHNKMRGDYECEFCKQRVPSEEKLNIHKRYHKVRYRCTVCNLTRVCRSTIGDHITNVHGNGMGLQYGCHKCEKTFKCHASLRKHLYYLHKDKIPCGYCNKQYATKESLKAHMRRIHPSQVSSSKPAKKYLCKECGMAMESPSQLRNHSAKHSLRRDHYCVECDKSFKTYTSLQQHLKTVSVHITQEDLKHPCPVCKKRFTTKGHAERHINDVHMKTARFYCDQCGKEYRCKYKLAGHIRKHEGYEKPRKFLCKVCSKGFYSKPVLEVHLRIHTGEKPFHCSECPAQFNQYGSLYNHKKLVHKMLGKSIKEANNDEKPKLAKTLKLDDKAVKK